MRLEHHLVGGYVRYISPYIIIIIIKIHWDQPDSNNLQKFSNLFCTVFFAISIQQSLTKKLI